MWLKLCVLALCGICSTQSVYLTPSQSVFTVAKGSNFEINCTVNKGAIEWLYIAGDQEEAVQVTTRVQIKGISPNGGENVSTLTIGKVTSDDAKTYRCKGNEDETPNEAEFQLIVFSVETENAEFKHNEDAVLTCHVETPGTYNYSWKKGETPVSEIPVEGKQKFIPHKNGSLEIRHALRSFAGPYTCVATYEDNGNTYSIEQEVFYYATPKVIPFDKSKNLMEKEKLVIECKVLGYPKPKISWWKGGKQIKTGEKSRYKLSPANTYNDMIMEDAKLVIESVVFDDGGEYMCLSENAKWPLFNSTQVILVRVKDQLAALWPFLGILAEVIILCTIIFIYEKKRNKDTAEDEDVNQDGAAPEKQTEGVRHRGTNNPRA